MSDRELYKWLVSRRPLKRKAQERDSTDAEVLRYREGCRLRAQLTRLLPENALDRYDELVGGLFGDNLDEVVRFALISFLHDRAGTLGNFGRRSRPVPPEPGEGTK